MGSYCKVGPMFLQEKMTPREEEAESRVIQLKANRQQGLPRAGSFWSQEKGISSPRVFRRKMVLSTPWFQTSGLQNCEIMNASHFKLLKLKHGYSTPRKQIQKQKVHRRVQNVISFIFKSLKLEITQTPINRSMTIQNCGIATQWNSM